VIDALVVEHIEKQDGTGRRRPRESDEMLNVASVGTTKSSRAAAPDATVATSISVLRARAMILVRASGSQAPVCRRGGDRGVWYEFLTNSTNARWCAPAALSAQPNATFRFTNNSPGITGYET
jgi:hypothetical protein